MQLDAVIAAESATRSDGRNSLLKKRANVGFWPGQQPRGVSPRGARRPVRERAGSHGSIVQPGKRCQGTNARTTPVGDSRCVDIDDPLIVFRKDSSTSLTVCFSDRALMSILAKTAHYSRLQMVYHSRGCSMALVNKAPTGLRAIYAGLVVFA